MSEIDETAEADERDVLTVREAADYLRTTPWHLYRLIDKGEVPCVRLGRSLRLSRKVLSMMIDGCVVEAED